jgi:hypothetical protein
MYPIRSDYIGAVRTCSLAALLPDIIQRVQRGMSTCHIPWPAGQSVHFTTQQPATDGRLNVPERPLWALLIIITRDMGYLQSIRFKWICETARQDKSIQCCKSQTVLF